MDVVREKVFAPTIEQVEEMCFVEMYALLAQEEETCYGFAKNMHLHTSMYTIEF